ncbi:hypothetical protein B0T18DRAFT_188393 [Schizothecium vesticola]|uniref:3-hydroxyacyl-CoA dehydrogenase n=1 Tax=Schizothecium vesticola TaxID=314040 RepID=A0AA40K2M1_9PEZI|nr:hypothetical protein B0T18DRAFT_188393 [Schizothecium vesticola]
MVAMLSRAVARPPKVPGTLRTIYTSRDRNSTTRCLCNPSRWESRRTSCLANEKITQVRNISTRPQPFFDSSLKDTHIAPPHWKHPTEHCLNERPVLIVGAGNLGRRLAVIWASNLRPVTLYDTSQDALDSAIEYVTDNLGDYCTARDTHPGHIFGTTDVRVATTTGRHEGTPPETEAADIELNSGAKGPWMAIDCLPESLELKVAVLSELEDLLPENCIMASNARNLMTAEMAPYLHHPERLLNTHYYIPPRNRMVELMSSTRTYDEIFPFLTAQMRRVGLVPIVVPGQSQGFIFNRIWGACKRETLAVLSEGLAMPDDVDALFRDFFHAEKGPCQRMDEVGLDTVAMVEMHALELRTGAKPEMAGLRVVEWLRRRYVDQNRLGEKTGDGLFTKEERDELKARHRHSRFKDVEETPGA